jgi:hypothetical protein
MNIFYIHSDPEIAAQMMVDKHVVKMILESAQLLSTAHRVLDGIQTVGESKTGRSAKRWILNDMRDVMLYQATHVNHPSAIWCRASVDNYLWLAFHLASLCQEYTHRYGKVHKVERDGLLKILMDCPYSLKTIPLTPMPCAMDPEYIISNDPVTNYRNYYNKGKVKLHAWTNRPVPDWIENNV